MCSDVNHSLKMDTEKRVWLVKAACKCLQAALLQLAPIGLYVGVSAVFFLLLHPA